MMATHLQRRDLSRSYRKVFESDTQLQPHAGLLLQHGLVEYDKDRTTFKKELIDQVCRLQISDLYRHAYSRWNRFISNHDRFRSTQMQLETRLFIGLTGSGMIETGCAVGHSHGAPYIPGSSVKGVVNAFARKRLVGDDRAFCDELFGSAIDEGSPVGLSGLTCCHDAWWVPDSAESPMVCEVVTSHHPDYYSIGKAPSDFDSPVPNYQVAIRGAFLFVVEGPSNWIDFTSKILIDALIHEGIGAKTNIGYGRFSAMKGEESSSNCEWVEQTIEDIRGKHRLQEWQVVEGRLLAKEWKKIDDPMLKKEAYLDIKKRWADRWKAVRLTKSARKARAIYDKYESTTGLIP